MALQTVENIKENRFDWKLIWRAWSIEDRQVGPNEDDERSRQSRLRGPHVASPSFGIPSSPTGRLMHKPVKFYLKVKSPVSHQLYHRIGWWENFTGNPDQFDGKNPWVSGVDFPLTQSIDYSLKSSTMPSATLSTCFSVKVPRLFFVCTPSRGFVRLWWFWNPGNETKGNTKHDFYILLSSFTYIIPSKLESWCQ